MRQCKGFVDENRDLVIEFCLALGDKPPTGGLHIHLQYPVPSALWTCPNSRCRTLNTRADTVKCIDCGTKDLDAGMRPVLDRDATAVELARHGVAASANILDRLKTFGDASE